MTEIETIQMYRDAHAPSKYIRAKLAEALLWPKWNELFYRLFPIASRTFRNKYDGD